jgi:hypothetical protein
MAEECRFKADEPPGLSRWSGGDKPRRSFILGLDPKLGPDDRERSADTEEGAQGTEP